MEDLAKIAKCVECKNESCLIKKNCLTVSEHDYLSLKNTISCRKGQSFIIEGAPVYGLYFVYQGKVKVSMTGLNGKEQIVRFAKDGEIIGHRGFGVGKNYAIGATAIEDTILCNFSNQILLEMFQKYPNLTFDFMMFYAEELNRSESKVKKFAQMTVREKVIDSLLYLNRKFGQKNGFLNLLLSRREIADFAGTTEEQVIRILSSLKKENLIEAKGKRIGIPNETKLKNEIADHNFFIGS